MIHPPYYKIIRVMCSGRVDPLFVFEAFKYGADGVIIGGCRLGECKYSEGNFQALIIGEFAKTLMNEIGINPDRLKLEWIASSESIKLIKDLNEFFEIIKNLGPLGKEKNWNEKDKMVYLNSASKVCQDRQIRTLLGNIATELKSLKDFSPSTIEKKIEEKLLDRLKTKLLEIEIKEFIQEGIKDFKTLLEKTQVEREVLEKIYFQIIKS
uniref:Hydrogenase iron-sulfur subunit n=1 Tax=Thermodesulfobacterium geofontis TaxID=1295609 RepID=A0A7V5XFG0_9BACT